MNQSNRQLRIQTVNNGFIEQLFLFDGATFAQRDLDHHQVVGADCLIRTTAPQLSLCFCYLIPDNRAPVSAGALPVSFF